MEETYKFTKKCTNCFQGNELTIPKGIMVRKYLPKENVKCTHCGCMIE